jgi:signal transduction histidine kinase
MQPADVNELCENVVLSQPRHVDWTPDPSVPEIGCDAARITQALSNVVGNAVKHSRGDVATGTALRGDSVEVTIADRGPGMPANFDAHLFVSHTNGTGMTGLGLPIARQIVEMHGGRLWFETGPRTVFTFSVPIAATLGAAAGGDFAGVTKLR